jgi:hypothetical protein
MNFEKLINLIEYSPCPLMLEIRARNTTVGAIILVYKYTDDSLQNIRTFIPLKN